VFLAASGQGRLRVYCWPEDYPDELSVGLFALREMALHDGVIAGPLTPGLEMGAPGPIDDGSRVGLGRSPAGDYVMVLQQPLGARQADGTRPVLQVEFCLDLPKRH
jgi:hypothetical protein